MTDDIPECLRRDANNVAPFMLGALAAPLFAEAKTAQFPWSSPANSLQGLPPASVQPWNAKT